MEENVAIALMRESLVDLSQAELALIHETVAGGAHNVQGIYPLTPLQEGMLFHHLLDEHGDTYVVSTLLEIQSQARVRELVGALQSVMDRHDILRSSIFWEQLRRPVQVIHSSAILPVEHLTLDPDRDALEQMKELMTPRHQKWDLRVAPLLRLKLAGDSKTGLFYALLQLHHTICDHGSLKLIVSEATTCLEGHAESLARPRAYRDQILEALSHSEASDAEEFFRASLGSVEETTAPFALLEVHADSTGTREAVRRLDSTISRHVRAQARQLGVTAARLFHAAWAIVVAQTSGKDDVVFGTALLATSQRRVQSEAAIGMFVNTLPLRIRLRGTTVVELIEQTQHALGELLQHESASLVTARRCSGLTGSTPLFTSLFGYRHSVPDPEADWARTTGVRALASNKYRTNFPLSLIVDNLGEEFELTAQTDARIDPERVIGYMETALASMASALEEAPRTPALALSILPQAERRLIIETFNSTQVAFPRECSIHQLFEEQVNRTPHAVAAVYQDQHVTYAACNETTNRFAHYLRSTGLQAGELVPLMIPRSLDLILIQLAVLKCGAAYVPIDPTHPVERRLFMVRDCGARRIIAAPAFLAEFEHLGLPLLNPATLATVTRHFTKANLGLSHSGRNSAYIMYTSGSTGTPKGVVVPHHAVNRLVIANGYAQIHPTDRVAHYSNPAFDASTFEIWAPLLNGASVVIIPQTTVLEGRALADLLIRQEVTALWMTVGLFTQHKEILADSLARLRYLLVGGDVVPPACARWVLENCAPRHFINGYGPTEGTTFSATYRIAELAADADCVPIGRPIHNTQIYILNDRLQPVPLETTGEIYIGGAGVAQGYLNQPALTAEKFIVNPFDKGPDTRLYKSGDLGRWRSDGAVVFLGRVDEQVKIRGHRVELGEIATRICQHARVKDALVVAKQEDSGDKQLIAYVVPDLEESTKAQEGSNALGAQVVAEWQKLYDETYSTAGQAPSFIGWNSSYTGEPIPESEMQEWLSATITRIRALQPERALEIGCGVGLLLQHLAPQCRTYVGTDFSASALSRLGNWMSSQENLKHVELLQRDALQLEGLQPGSFDLVILNSVVQYFPDINYLLDVIRGVAPLLRPGGRIFIGDVRNLGSLRMFHTAVQLSKATATMGLAQLQKRIARALSQDKELVIDPDLFRALPGNIAGISAADIHLKKGAALNELTRHRYDVTLEVDASPQDRPTCDKQDWQISLGSIERLESALAEHRWPIAHFDGIPNLRLQREEQIVRVLETGDPLLDVAWARAAVNRLPSDGIDPEIVWDLAQKYGYEAKVGPDRTGCFQMQLLDPTRRSEVAAAVSRIEQVATWDGYATHPTESTAAQNLIPELRHHLKSALPDYMQPGAWVILKQFPLTPNGKVDRRALPAPQGRPEEVADYIAPRSQDERELADIWLKLLPVDQVGVHDNFFELGGHSLLAMRVVSRIADRLNIELSVSSLFEAPTIESLSLRLESERQRKGEKDDRWMQGLSQELREEIEQLPEDEVLAQIRDLEKELEMDGTSWT